MTKLRGLVMCGGQSTRMGTDKGLIGINDTCWAGFMAAKLSALGLPVSISINSAQLQSYSVYFKADDLVVDVFKIGGPLNGLLSVHFNQPESDWLLVACDMIDMQSQTIERLIASYQNNPGHDFYVYQNPQFAEPFCGIYTAAALLQVALNIEKENLSLQKLLKNGKTFALPVTEPESFTNYNSLA